MSDRAYTVTNLKTGGKKGRPKGRKSKYTVSEAALTQRRGNAAKMAVRPAETPEGMDYNSRLIEHIMRTQEIATNADRHDLLSLKSCFMAYVRLCQEDGFPLSNMACYAAMGMTLAQFTKFAMKDDPEIRAFVNLVKSTCAMSREAQVNSGTLNPVIGIFWQRNFDGLRNDTEQVQAIQQQDDDYSAGEKYKEKYKNLIGE